MPLVAVNHQRDILPELSGTVVEDLLLNHISEFRTVTMPSHPFLWEPVWISGSGFNVQLILPTSRPDCGSHLRYSEFQLSYAIAVGRVSAIALIGHTQCAMVNLISHRELFVSGLVERAGWPREWAEAHFLHYFPMFEIGNEMDFLYGETLRLRTRYPKILIAPLIYRVEDNKLYQLATPPVVSEMAQPQAVMKGRA